jgi:hypothetical protein
MKPNKRMVAFFNIGRQLDHGGNLVSSYIVRKFHIVRARSGNAGHADARPADEAAAVKRVLHHRSGALPRAFSSLQMAALEKTGSLPRLTGKEHF